MTKEDIEKAVGDYSGSSLGFTENNSVMANHKAFAAGADWRINSVWHDASEIPEANKRVLVCFENVIDEYVYYRIRGFKPNVLKKCNMRISSLDKVLYWCYLDDLLPERKEEQP